MKPKTQREKFINALFDQTAKKINLRAIKDRNVSNEFVSNLDEIEDFIKKYSGYDIYFGVCTREEGKGTKDGCREITALWCDIDGKDFSGGLEEITQTIKNFPLKPSAVISSGSENSYHLYWLLKEPEDATEKIEGYLKGIANVLNGDMTATDLSRIMRVPGTNNYKNGNAKDVVLHRIDENLRYNLMDFDDFCLEQDSKEFSQENKTPITDLYQGVDEGSRNESLARLTGSWTSDGLSFEECMENARLINSKNNPPMPDAEVETTVRSIFDKHHRDLCQLSPPLYEDKGTDKINDNFDPYSVLKKGSDLQKLDITVEWAVEGVNPKESITLLSGKGGIGKTWLAIELANAVSKGQDFMGLKTKQTPVVYIDFENSLAVLIERINKTGASEVYYWHSTNEIKPPKLDSDNWTLYQKLPKGALIIFDTLRASQSKDENDSRHMAFIMNRLKELRDMGFTIILLHHTPKANDRTYKGSTAIFDLSDHVLSLHKVKKGNFQELEEEDSEDCYYKFGTKDKTRYEPFHIFLNFVPEKGFVVAPDPDTDELESIQELIKEKGKLSQSQLFEVVKKELDIKGKKKFLRLLRKGEGQYWSSQKEGRKVIYEPVSTIPYRGETSDTIEQKPPHLSPTNETGVIKGEAQSIEKSIDSTCPPDKGQIETDETINLIGTDFEVVK